MAGAEQIFRRLEGRGWIVLGASLAGPGSAQRDLGNRILQHLDLSLEPVLARPDPGGGTSADEFAEEVEAWLGIPVRQMGARQLGKEDWSQIGLLTMTDGPAETWLEALAASGEAAASLEHLGEGSRRYAVGAAAQALGSWFPGPDGLLREGLGWLPGAIVLPGEADPVQRSEIRELLGSPGPRYALGLPEGAILAIGPGGEAEVWGSVQPTLVLGRGWRPG